MSNPNYQSGGAFLPARPARVTASEPWNFDQAPTVGTEAGQGAQTTVTNANVQSITATGSTGSTAAAVTAVPGRAAFVAATGTSGAGLNLPTGVGGEWGVITNLTTGVVKVYAIASTLNGVSGTTGVSITATGNLSAMFWCQAAGAWQVRFNS